MATTTLDSLISETGRRPGIGAAAEPLVRELLQFMTRGPGGFAAFLDRFRSAGLGAEVTSFVGGANETPLPVQSVDTVIGETAVQGMAKRAGLAPAAAATAIGFVLPRLIGLLTPGGRMPTALPRDIESFVGRTEQVSPVAMATLRDDEQVRPVAMTTVREPARRVGFIWLLALLALAILAGIIWTLMSRPAPTPVAPVATAPAVVAPAPAPTPVETINVDQTVLNFATASAVLPEAAGPMLREAAAQIKALPAGSTVEVAGHTDNVGDPAANLSLSQRRAEAVRAALLQDGVDAGVLTARGYGETKPIASNDTEQGRLQNRRTELDVFRK